MAAWTEDGARARCFARTLPEKPVELARLGMNPEPGRSKHSGGVDGGRWYEVLQY